MMKAQWIFLLITVIFSILSIVFLSLSFGSQTWINAGARYLSEELSVLDSEINYGLFKGLLVRKITETTSFKYELSVICDYEANKCMFSCHENHENMVKDLNNVLTGADPEICLPSLSKSSIISKDVESESSSYRDLLINAGLLTSVYSFLAFSLIFAIVGAFFSTLNIWYSSPYGLMNIDGLYIWNGLVILFISLTLILYGSLYGSYLSKNIAIADTLSKTANYSSDGLAGLGYSYWILFIPLILHIGNILILKYRTVLINKNTPPPVLSIEKCDSTILVY